MRTNTLKSLFSLMAVCVLSLAVAGCENEEIGSLNDTPPVSTSQPTISSVLPVGTAQAGVDTMIITGTNFSTEMSKNIVYFNATPGQIIDGSATQLRVKIPLVLGDSVVVRVAVQSSDLLSEAVYYDLNAAIQEFGSLSPSESVTGLTTDATGNLYVAISAQSSDLGLFRITPAGVRTSYAPPTVGVAAWSAIRWGPNDTIYAARNVRAIYYYPPGGSGTSVLWVGGSALPVGTAIADLDFDQNKYMWAVGTNTSNVANARIFCIKPNKTITSVPFEAGLKAARVFNGYLYVSGVMNNVQGIWRSQILGDSLAAPTVVFDLTMEYGADNIAYGFTLASDGTSFLGTDTPEGIVVVSPAGSSGSPFGSYQSLMASGVRAFAWGAGDALYAATNAGKLSMIATRTTSAPYLGTQ